jgi:broad specificity phosphatase PhoE
MRHGIARHNHHNIKIQSPIYLDASLDTTGAHQALAVGMRFRNVVGHGHVNVTKEKVEPIDLVCVSPLTRCLETAHHAWAFGCPMMPTETGAVEVEDEATRRRKLKVRGGGKGEGARGAIGGRCDDRRGAIRPRKNILLERH